MLPDLIFPPNGIDVDTGKPATPLTGAYDLLQAILKEEEITAQDPLDSPGRVYDSQLGNLLTKEKLGLLKGKVENLEDAGWGVLFPAGTPEQVRKDLEDLIESRKKEVGNPAYFKNLDVDSGMNVISFRKKHEETAGDINPEKLPYYLMIVGPPAPTPDFPSAISFEFQHRLAAVHAVGRLCFDQLSGYREYADRLLAYESDQIQRQAEVALFSPASDRNTRISSQYLAAPLKTAIEKDQLKPVKPSTGGSFTYRIQHADGDLATRSRLIEQLSSKASLLFTASHGLTKQFNLATPDESFALQKSLMGSLLCQEWPGMEGPVTPDQYLAGADLKSLDLSGLIWFAFACYGLGVPQVERFADFYKVKPRQIAKTEFISALPQAALSRGCLAFIGHVDESWGYSFIRGGIGPDIKNFDAVITKILRGERIGAALETFSRSYLHLNDDLTSAMGLINGYRSGLDNGEDILAVWMERQDARSWALLGDPAVRLGIDRFF